MKKIVVPFIGILCAITVLAFLYINKTTLKIDISDEQATQTAILSEFGAVAENVIIHKVELSGNLIFALYSDNKSGYIGIEIFEKVFPFGNRYRGIGSAYSSSKSINTYNYRGQILDSEGLIVVFGDNTKKGASFYSFVNGENEYKNEILDSYFIDLFYFDEMDTSNCSELVFYDRNGNRMP